MHKVKFNENIKGLIYQKLGETSVQYNSGSLRLALNRITQQQDDLLCVFTIHNDGYLSVKNISGDKKVYIESIILPQEEAE
jgi:hypothetical protein